MSDFLVEPTDLGTKRVRRTAEEKRRIEATLVAGASMARVAREHGVNANQVFQWRYEYRKGTLGLSQRSLMPVTVAAELTLAAKPDRGPAIDHAGAIHIDLHGLASIRFDSGASPELVCIVLGSLVP